MPSGELTCGELVELVSDYVEGRLPAAEQRRVEDHLDRCGGCRAYLEQMRATVGLAGRLREDDLTPAGRERLLAAFRGWRG